MLTLGNKVAIGGIFYAGLHWLSESRDREFPLPRSLRPLLFTLRELEVINDDELQEALRNSRLRDIVHRKLAVCPARDGLTQEQTLAQFPLRANCHFVWVRPTLDGFNPRMLIGRHGYRLRLTPHGVAYVEQIAEQYVQFFTPEQFVAAWVAVKERTAELMRLRRGQLGTSATEELIVGEFDESAA